MPFIGQQPVTGAYHKLDSITTSATATYNLQLNGGAYSPASANHLLVSLNGVIQAPQDSFTVSGSQITFASALTSSDSIDFIMAFGDVLNIGTPSDGTVGTTQLTDGGVTNTKLANSSITVNGTSISLGGSGTISAGKVLQVVEANTSSLVQNVATTSFITTGLSASITPSSTSSKILVDFRLNGYRLMGGSSDGIQVKLERNSSQIEVPIREVAYPTGSQFEPATISNTYLDSPSSTSAVTYEVFFRCLTGNQTIQGQANSAVSRIILMEIEG